MKRTDVGLALLCVLLWGSTFPVIKALLAFTPAVFLNAARFCVIALPALFLPFPKISKFRFFAYALLFGCGQYLLSTLSMHLGLSAGVAAVLMQVQVFVTILLSWVFLKEGVRREQLIGVVLGFGGLLLFVLFNTSLAVSVSGLVAVVAASLSWAAVNMIVKVSRVTNLTSLVAWGAITNVPILFAVSWQMGELSSLHPTTPQLFQLALGLIFLGLVVTFGVSVIWNRLLQKHDAIKIVPFSILIPIVGMCSSWLIFDDLAQKQLFPMALVLLGLAITFVKRQKRAVQAEPQPVRVPVQAE
ncbi:MAG: EamA family transporter [Deltaproteobacteria bacterium]|nr:EamA family transporter [Deltaproteobacteria bacterium]